MCDQPRVLAQLLRSLVETHQRTGKTIVASSYGEHPTPGVPAYFSKSWFNDLESLGDQAGAKSLIMKHPQQTEVVASQLPELDIDTPEDYRRLLEME